MNGSRNPWIVLANVKCDWPEVFGPWTNLSDAERAAETLENDPRVADVEIQALLRGDEVALYLAETLHLAGDRDDAVSDAASEALSSLPIGRDIVDGVYPLDPDDPDDLDVTGCEDN